ncbi:radical SAM protein [Clostridium sp. KNHs205]|jgi:nitrogen fixation protein NifB|uniref:radical SAM protein n=1 Tax=Clostridium sp. KNHs205 TaxID=1449050 RepID=UPI00051C869C|nr:radical SAM protein [Clostridium sp. KNHs205]
MSNYENLKNSHPCFGGHKTNKGRIHLPVSPGCNIECKFCDRKINQTEQRPGVSSGILKESEALEVIRRSLELCPEITVAGIAGPGDTLASPYALNTFKLIKEEFPDLLKCMSTNGLLLYEKADEVIEAGIDSLTVTVNAVAPSIQAKICTGIYYHGKRYEGEEGARILIENQLRGIKKVADAGITIKVNTVLIPGINEDHIEEIARIVSEAGATIYNIIPLIPQHELKEVKAPGCLEIDSARLKAGKYIDVFRHCQRCRADAVGIPGEKEFADQIYFGRLSMKETFSHG